MIKKAILNSVHKTGRVIIIDGGWEKLWRERGDISDDLRGSVFSLKNRIARLALPDAPAPSCRFLEEAYYIL